MTLKCFKLHNVHIGVAKNDVVCLINLIPSIASICDLGENNFAYGKNEIRNEGSWQNNNAQVDDFFGQFYKWCMGRVAQQREVNILVSPCLFWKFEDDGNYDIDTNNDKKAPHVLEDFDRNFKTLISLFNWNYGRAFCYIPNDGRVIQL